MSAKDKRIWSQDGGRYPFRVSDEYFDNLTARIMKQVDALEEVEAASEKESQVVDLTLRRRHNVWLKTVSVAASLALIATIALKFIPLSTSQAETEALTAEYAEDEYNEELMSYTMADNMAVYDYLSGYAEE